MPELNRVAPDFSLPADDGTTVRLKALRGQPVVLYFYPKDDTTSCTQEACEFRDLFPRFKRSKAIVLGVSPDPVKSHLKFKAKYELPFTLLADTEHAVCELYGVWKEKSMYGRKYMGVERSTFLIDAKGKLRQAWIKVVSKGHAEAVFEAVQALG
ncbi:MAG: thioredoxin-dependent thiol peroxidase [Gemmatimonadetes bacterium]|nr:thioredoxin-dependent thiol peroxidase [Gemmatimonadota bacterium]